MKYPDVFYIILGPLGVHFPQIAYVLEGDRASYLWLVQNGLVYRDRIEWGTWDGRYARAQDPGKWAPEYRPNHLFDSVDATNGADGVSYKTHRALIWRWRAAYQDDFAGHMQWTLTPNFTSAGYSPVINVNGHEGPDPLSVKVASNQTYTFNASLTYDPDYLADSSKLSFEWALYADPTKFLPVLEIQPLAQPGTILL